MPARIGSVAWEAILLQTGVETGFYQRDFCQTNEQQRTSTTKPITFIQTNLKLLFTLQL